MRKRLYFNVYDAKKQSHNYYFNIIRYDRNKRNFDSYLSFFAYNHIKYKLKQIFLLTLLIHSFVHLCSLIYLLYKKYIFFLVSRFINKKYLNHKLTKCFTFFTKIDLNRNNRK